MSVPWFLLKAKGALKKIDAAKTVKDSLSSEGTAVMSNRLPTILVSLTFVGMFVGMMMLVSLISQGSTQSLGVMQAVDPLAEAESSSSGSSTTGTSASGVVNCARQQIGKPYVWGAEGPDSFDCSGLVTYCYRQALSVEVGHYTGTQMTDTKFKTVSSVDELAAGDIILDGGSIMPSHVGIYSGEGTVIHAPTFNDKVREVPLAEFYGWVTGNETFRHYVG